jgi:hypothetical protein
MCESRVNFQTGGEKVPDPPPLLSLLPPLPLLAHACSLSVGHVPTGCSVWPAFWTVTEDLSAWPIGGEIDITENANDQYPGALSSLHTSTSCTIPSTISAETGTVQYTNCSAYATGDPGCRSELSSSSWGSTLNKAGGGTFAMERSLGSTGNGVRVWFWSKGDEPTDLASGSTTVTPDSWGSPGADFDIADECSSDFGPHNVSCCCIDRLFPISNLVTQNLLFLPLDRL